MGDDEDEIKQLTRELKKARKQHDELNHSVKSATGTLEKLKDEVSDLELESRRPNLEDSPQTRKIRTLENRLDKAMIKYNEAESIKKTYEQIAKRLREERVGFDNQLAAIERTLAAKNHDCEELMLLAGDATHAKELTFKDLDRMRSLYDEDRRKRQKELKEKEQVMQVKIDMHERLMSRDQQAQELIAKQASTLSPAEEAQVREGDIIQGTLNIIQGMIVFRGIVIVFNRYSLDSIPRSRHLWLSKPLRHNIIIRKSIFSKGPFARSRKPRV